MPELDRWCPPKHMGLVNAPVNNMHLPHGKHLSLMGLKASSNLTHLCLDQPDLHHSDDLPWFKQLQQIASLRSVTLIGQAVGNIPQSLAKLAQTFQVSQLQSLVISDWKASDNEFWASQAHLPTCPQLTSLHLSGALRWPTSAFEALPCVQSLWLHGPNILLPSSLSTLTQLTYLSI